MKNRRQDTDPDGVIQVLSYSSDAVDHIRVEAGLDSRWVIYRSASVAEAVDALQATAIPVIIADSDSPASRWRDLLERIQQLPEPPALILASWLADERLWAEALNLGAYDVLTKPFERHELIRSVTGAWLHWHSLRDQRRRTLRDRRAVAQWNAAPG
jgi:CheY-like chemotaxis protein